MKHRFHSMLAYVPTVFCISIYLLVWTQWLIFNSRVYEIQWQNCDIYHGFSYYVSLVGIIIAKRSSRKIHYSSFLIVVIRYVFYVCLSERKCQKWENGDVMQISCHRGWSTNTHESVIILHPLLWDNVSAPRIHDLLVQSFMMKENNTHGFIFW